MQNARWSLIAPWTEGVHDYLWLWLGRITISLLILVVGLWLAKLLSNLIGRLLGRILLDTTVARFLQSFSRFFLYAIVVTSFLGQLGVQTDSLLAILAAAGLGIGLALQKPLADLVAGVLLLLLRPYAVTDLVEVAGISGTVERVHLLQTIIHSPDNRELTIPNGKIISDVITNNTVLGKRRIDLVISIAHDADLHLAKDLLDEIMTAESRILSEPAATSGVHELGDIGVQLYARPWVLPMDYNGTRADLLEAIKLRFDAEGIALASRLSFFISSGENRLHSSRSGDRP